MNYHDRIDKVTQDYLSSFRDLSPEILDRSPAQREWSINQIVDHVNILNRSYFPIFEEVQTGKFSTPIIGNFRFFAKYLGRKILDSVKVNNPKKVKTAGIWKPSEKENHADVFQTFEQTQEELKAYIDGIDKWIRRDIVIHSPASRSVVYPIRDALNIIITHEERHYQQALSRLK